MAEFDVDFPDDFLGGLLETDSEQIIKEALDSAAPMVESTMKDILRKDGHELSGELIGSIKATKAKRAKNGAWIVNVRPTGYSTNNTYYSASSSRRKYKISNALKAIWIEYGISGQQPARPFLTRTVNETRECVMKRMQEIYNQKVRK